MSKTVEKPKNLLGEAIQDLARFGLRECARVNKPIISLHCVHIGMKSESSHTFHPIEYTFHHLIRCITTVELSKQYSCCCCSYISHVFSDKNYTISWLTGLDGPTGPDRYYEDEELEAMEAQRRVLKKSTKNIWKRLTKQKEFNKNRKHLSTTKEHFPKQ